MQSEIFNVCEEMGVVRSTEHPVGVRLLIEDVAEVDRLIEQAVQLQQNDPMGMIAVAQQANLLAMAANYAEGISRSLTLIGKAHVRLGNLLEADEALTRAESCASLDSALQADIHNSHGNVYFYLKIYDKAFFYYQQSLALAKHIGDRALEAKLLNNIALIYRHLKDYPKSLDYFRESLEAQNELQDFNSKSVPVGNVGRTYLELDDLDNAERYLKQAVEIAEEQNDRMSKSFALQYLGTVARKRGQREQAVRYLEESLAIYRSTHELLHATQALLEFHRVYLAEGNAELCLHYLKLAMTVAEEADSQANRLEVYSALAYLHESMGDLPTSLHYHKKCRETAAAIEQETRQQRLRAIGVQIAADQSFQEKETYRALSQELNQKATQLESAYQTVRAIGDVGRSVVATLDLERIYQLVYQHLPDLMHSDVFGVGLHHPESDTIEYHYLMDAGTPISGMSISMDNRDSFAVTCFKQKRGFLVNSLSEDVSAYVGKLTHSMPWPLCAALMLQPLMVEDEMIGVIMVQSRTAGVYTEHALDMLGLLASYLSLAIQITRKTDQLKDEIRQRELAEQALRHLNRELNSLSNRDGLTGVANRRYFGKFLHDAWSHALRQQLRVSLLMIDIDYFKQFNDRNGHLPGDEVIKQIAQAMQRRVKRGTDLVARYGGDEFVVLLGDTDDVGALHIAEEIQAAVSDCCIQHAVSSVSSQVTISIGVVTMVPSRETQPSDLVVRGDAALYRAKAAGRNRICVFAAADDTVK